jgi:hypothetical protein
MAGRIGNIVVIVLLSDLSSRLPFSKNLVNFK